MPRMTHWNERTYFSLRADADVVRISGFDDHCQEHWIEIVAGRGFRDRRTEAVTKIMDAIESGHEAGQVI